MNATEKLNERFVKDTGLPIKVFKEPFFSERLEMLAGYSNAKIKYAEFLKLLEKFKNEQEYFEAYNKLKDAVINYLSENEAMNAFKETPSFKDSETNNLFAKRVFPKKDIFKDSNIGKSFISIDMVRANFTALKHYDKNIVGGKDTYEEFIGMFTDEEHFKNSKYIRQVVFGNHSPKKQVAYETYLMGKVLMDILEFVPDEAIQYFSTDEIIIDSSFLTSETYAAMVAKLVQHIKAGIEVSLESYTLAGIKDEKNSTVGFVKFFDTYEYEVKCVSSVLFPLVMRLLMDEEVTENDTIFEYVADVSMYVKMIDVPKLRIVETI